MTLGGNATVLMECEGRRIVTDPWLSDNVGPWRRLRPPALSLADLMSATLVLISHGHGDHLDAATLTHLPRETPVISPYGLPLRRLRSLGLSAVEPLSPWEQWAECDLRVTAVPHSTRVGHSVTCWN